MQINKTRGVYREKICVTKRDEILSKNLQWSNIENNSNLNPFRDVKDVKSSNLYSAGFQYYHAIEFFIFIILSQ